MEKNHAHRIENLAIVLLPILYLPIMPFLAAFVWADENDLLAIIVIYIIPIFYLIYSIVSFIKRSIKKNLVYALIFFLFDLPLVLFVFFLTTIRLN